MKRTLIFLIIFLAFLCSCNEYDLDIYDTEEISYVEDTSGTKYVISVNGSTFHSEDCYVVNNMKEENKRVFYDRNFFKERGITPCKRCKP